MAEPPRVLIAAGEMKGSLTAQAAAGSIRRGVREARPDVSIDSLALSDGGAGLVDLMLDAAGFERRSARVPGPLGKPTNASWAFDPASASAAIEMSAAAGHALVPADQRDPERTSTFGVGQLIREALDAGAHAITLGIGNSATCDAGIGMAAALGAVFFDESDEPITRPTGGDMHRVSRIDAAQLDPRLKQTKITVLCDVTNPLFGPDGSAHVFAPQKGASPEQVQRLDAGLRNIARLLPVTDPDAPGMGAAGGIAFGLAAFCRAKLKPGADAVLDLAGFNDLAADADLVLTCEGRFDHTSVNGKLPIRVADRAAPTRTIILAGSVADGAHNLLPPNARLRPIAPPDMPIAQAIAQADDLLAHAANRAVVELLT